MAEKSLGVSRAGKFMIIQSEHGEIEFEIHDMPLRISFFRFAAILLLKFSFIVLILEKLSWRTKKIKFSMLIFR